MIIFIRGLPGSGKTTISDKVAEKLGWNVVHADEFKKELMRQKPDADFVREIVPASYKLTLGKLGTYKNSSVIIEEVFRNKEFVQSVLDFCNKNSIKYQWFKIIRDENLLLQVYAKRTRKVKMTKDLHDMFKQQMNDIKIEGEVTINNENIDKCVEEIIGHFRV